MPPSQDDEASQKVMGPIPKSTGQPVHPAYTILDMGPRPSPLTGTGGRGGVARRPSRDLSRGARVHFPCGTRPRVEGRGMVKRRVIPLLYPGRVQGSRSHCQPTSRFKSGRVPHHGMLDAARGVVFGVLFGIGCWGVILGVVIGGMWLIPR